MVLWVDVCRFHLGAPFCWQVALATQAHGHISPNMIRSDKKIVAVCGISIQTLHIYIYILDKMFRTIVGSYVDINVSRSIWNMHFVVVIS